jgi:hypothetical protein
MRHSPDACAEVCEIAADPDDSLHADARSAATKFKTPRGMFKNSPGEIPPAYRQIQDTLSQARERARSPRGRAWIQKLADEVAHSIEWWRRREEEDMDPHG